MENGVQRYKINASDEAKFWSEIAARETAAGRKFWADHANEKARYWLIIAASE